MIVLTLFAAGLGRPSEAGAQTTPAFASPPTFGSQGLALAVFNPGSVGALESAAQGVGASGVWAQDGGGRYQLLVIGGPSFPKTPFNNSFPNGFTSPTAVTLVRTPSPVVTQPTPTPAPPPTANFASSVPPLLLAEMNAMRAANGVAALSSNATLNSVAAEYASLVFQRDPYLVSPGTVHSLDGEPWDRATRAGYRWASYAENVAQPNYTRMTPDAATVARSLATMWLNSTAHRDNMLASDFTETGVGCTAGRPAVARNGSTPDVLVLCIAVFGRPR